MISLAQLWMPILLSAIALFAVSSLIHMVLKWHKSEYGKLVNEDDVRAAIRKGQPAPGQYILPYCTDPKSAQMPEMKRKFEEGPVGMLILRANGAPGMGPMLLQWYVYLLLLGVVVAYLASRTLTPGATFASVFRVVATVSTLAFVCGSIQNGIWMGRKWSSVAVDALDAIIYGAVSGAVFGWLWPH